MSARPDREKHIAESVCTEQSLSLFQPPLVLRKCGPPGPLNRADYQAL